MTNPTGPVPDHLSSLQPSQGNSGCHTAAGQAPISVRLINGKGHRTTATGALPNAGRPFPSPSAKDASVAATKARQGRIRGIFPRDRKAALPRARRTRPAFLHIGAAENCSFVPLS